MQKKDVAVSWDNVVVHELDAKGLACPLPLLKAKQRLKELVAGDCLRVLSTDQGSVRDFKAFAELSGHFLIEQTQDQDTYIHLLQKAQA